MKTGHSINQGLITVKLHPRLQPVVCIGLIIIVLKPGETEDSDHMVMIIIMTEESIFVLLWP